MIAIESLRKLAILAILALNQLLSATTTTTAAAATTKATTSQQHPNILTATTQPQPQHRQDYCSIKGIPPTVKGLKLEEGPNHLGPDVWAHIIPGEFLTVLECPISLAVVIKSNCIDNPQAQDLADQIRSNLSACAWFKDDQPVVQRANANPIIFPWNKEQPNSLPLVQPSESDFGFYRCALDYSKVKIAHINGAKNCLKLYTSIKFEVQADNQDPAPKDSEPHITHPPFPMKAVPGQNVTFTCHHIDTRLSQRVDWFRSNCNISDSKHFDGCMDQFIYSFNKTYEERQSQILHYMRPYFILDADGDTLTINNVNENDVDTYGCMVSNELGLDIRRASLTLDCNINGTCKHLPSLTPQVSAIQQANPTGNAVSIFLGSLSMLVLFLVGLGVLCFTKLGLKISKHSPLLKHMVAEDNRKEDSTRQHLPKIESPNIYNIGKSDDGYIYGHFQQKNGHLMAQSMCSPNLIMEKNLSISSNNYHSDESCSWDKTLSSSGDNSRASYHHTSNNTATTVPLYDHPPSTGTTQVNGALVPGSCVMNPMYGFLRPDFDARNFNWTFSRRNLEPQKIIGKGQFGEVWRYKAHQKDGTVSYVAVKKLTVRGGQEQQAKGEILKEIEIMKRVNDHPNVIKFLNTCVDSTSVLLIMEYADNGTLQTHLRQCRYAKDKDSGCVTSKELLKYSYHVAKGMEYIESRGVVHRDLATRNILLSKEKICKIADFGLARFVGESGIYQRLDRNQPVPIKWMAPESLTEYGTYTSKSDVFSVGVLMWEIVTLGATPYDFLPSSEVLKKVVSGGRLSRPEHCKEEFYKIMDRCWHQDPVGRPTFRELANELEVLLQSENDYIQLDKYPEHAYYNINTSENAEKEMVSSLPIYPELDNVFDQS